MSPAAERGFSVLRFGLRLLLALTCVASLTACAQLTADSGTTGSVFEDDIFGNIGARHPAERGGGTARGLVPVRAGAGASQNYGPEGGAGAGSDTALAAGAGQAAGGGAGSYVLNFENAEIKDVVRAVLGDALQLNYTISADVGGQVTISSARPVSRDELLSILETVLIDEGFSLSKTKTGYSIAPSGLGAGTVDRGARTSSNYGTSIVPLRFVSVATMTRLLNGFIVDSEGLRVSVAQNAVVVRGPGLKREEAVQAILSFDADWMADQSVSIFEVRRAAPEAVVAELERIFASEEGGAGAGVIEFKPITRLRAVMAVSKNPRLIKRAETFVRRLDQVSESVEENVFVYRARYRDARELARIVTTLFQAGGDAGAAQPTVQTAAATDTTSDADSESSDGTANADDGSGGESSESDDGSGSSDDGSLIAGGEDTGAAQTAAAPGAIDLTRQGTGDGASAVRISADVANNSVVTYADGETYEKILAALQQLDSTPLQVAINVTIAEVRLTDQLQYGVQYFVKSGNVGLADDKGSVGLFSAAADTLQKQIPGFNFLVGTDSNPDVIISALDEITDVEILSSPSLVVLENQTATLQVGDEVPITVRQAQSIEDVSAPLINQVEFRDTGIILNVTPRIGQNDAVTMQIEQEISAVVGGSGTLTPTISKRRIASGVSVVSGQTVLLAGLISATKTTGKSGIPVLGRAPGIGDLFSKNTKSSGRTELVVLIRPVVVRNGEDAQSVAEDLRSRMWAIGSRQPLPASGGLVVKN